MDSADNNQALTGEDFGAIRVTELDKLHDGQRRAVVGIIRSIHQIACNAYTSKQDRKSKHKGKPDQDSALRDRREYERPHNAYVIDGPRGSGKTTALLTLRSYLDNLCLDPGKSASDASNGEPIDALKGLNLKAPLHANGREKVGLVLPVVFTEDMELKEAAMDAVFALIQQHLEHRIESISEPVGKKALNRLLDDLRNNVTLPWAYSRGIGHEALAQDTIDYRDYVKKRANYNREAYTRVPTWHLFLERLLDELGFELLIVQFDDSDLDQRAAEDILRAIRIYLSHPRIVSVLAVDIETLSTAVYIQNLSRNSSVIQALNEGSGVERLITDTDKNSRALLDKVLPTALRHRLMTDDLSYLNGFFKRKSASDTYITSSDAFGAWCHERFIEATDPLPKGVWWLLNGPYRRLIADNIRHVVAFREQTNQTSNAPHVAFSDYYRLRNLMNFVENSFDQLRAVIEIGTLEASSWTGIEAPASRMLDDYEELFVDMWVDANIFARKLVVRNSALVRGWLPKPLGEERDLAISDTDKHLGVAGIEPSLLPRNCLYVYQYRRLARVLAEPIEENSWWVERLDELDGDDLIKGAQLLYKDIQDLTDRATLSLIVTQLDRVRSISKFSDRFRGRFQERVQKSTAALFVASRRGVNDRHSFITTLAEVANGMHDEAAGGFLQRLTESVRQAERRRQEALFTWACALEVADMGDNNKSLRVAGPRKQLAISIGPFSELQESRLHILVNKTTQHVAEGGRHAILLQWSLQQLLPVLHGYGADYIRPSNSTAAWRELAGCIKSALEHRDAKFSEDAKPWIFADMDPSREANILEIIPLLTQTFQTLCSPSTAAGSITLSDVWPDSPERLLAALLITSEAWVKENNLVA